MINYNYDYVPFFKEIIGNPYEFNSNIHFKINNRRYLGNKSKLVNFINSVVVEEIKEFLNVDSLTFLDINNMKKACGNGKPNNFCCACFDGKYPSKIDKNKLNA